MSLTRNELSPEGILTITLTAAASRNALSQAMMATLHEAIETAGTNNDVRVIVLAAEGPAFCAGHDLKEIQALRSEADKGAAAFAVLFERCANLMQAVVACPKPVIAKVNGIATAAGCQLVASCDLALATKASYFATPGVNIGLFCSTPMVALSRNVSRKHAMEMLLTGDMVNAKRAKKIGLINSIAKDAEDLDEKTSALANKIASKSLATVKIGKQAFYEQAVMPLADAYAFTSAVMTNNLLGSDAIEGIGAFVEKRVPRWSDT